MAVIRTITLNIGFDEIYVVDQIVSNSVARMLSHRTVAAGKGINAARTVSQLGANVTAYAIVGQNDLEYFSQLVLLDGISPRFIPIDQPTRHNLTLVQSDGGNSIHF